jgi:hypothetical protein
VQPAVKMGRKYEVAVAELALLRRQNALLRREQRATCMWRCAPADHFRAQCEELQREGRALQRQLVGLQRRLGRHENLRLAAGEAREHTPLHAHRAKAAPFSAEADHWPGARAARGEAEADQGGRDGGGGGGSGSGSGSGSGGKGPLRRCYHSCASTGGAGTPPPPAAGKVKAKGRARGLRSRSVAGFLAWQPEGAVRATKGVARRLGASRGQVAVMPY